MLKPLTRSGGAQYRPEDIADRADRRLVNREGYTLKGAKAALVSSIRRLRHELLAAPARTMPNLSRSKTSATI